MSDRTYTKKQERAMKQFIKTLPNELERVHPDEFPIDKPARVIDVWRSKKYVVQVYSEDNGIIRLSINRTTRHGGNWADKMTWDELQQIKADVGYGDSFAVEVYPSDKDVINVANMRHLWILPIRLSFAWTNK